MVEGRSAMGLALLGASGDLDLGVTEGPARES
jgi:hypothetical protein